MTDDSARVLRNIRARMLAAQNCHNPSWDITDREVERAARLTRGVAKIDEIMKEHGRA